MIYGKNNVAKRPDVRKKISDRKWQGCSFKCLFCGVEKRVMPSRVGVKKFCSRVCRGKYISAEQLGSKAMNWKGGKLIDKRGYVLVTQKDHPCAHSGYVFEHRLVMEKYLGRYLELGEIVHHKNEVKTDNRIENLELLSISEHMKLHYALRKRNVGSQFLPSKIC